MNHCMCLSSSFVLVTFASLSIQDSAAIVIDDFRVGPVSLSAQTTWVDQVQTGLDPNRVVGSSRHISIRSTEGPIGSQLEIDPSHGELIFSSDPAAFGYLTLNYGAEDPLGLDLTVEGDDRFLMRFPEVLNSGPSSRFNGQLQVWSGTGESTVIQSYSLSAVTEPGTVEIPFAYFDSVDISDVSKISLNVSRYWPGSRFRLTQIVTIPEPSAIGIAATIIWCLVFPTFPRETGSCPVSLRIWAT